MKINKKSRYQINLVIRLITQKKNQNLSVSIDCSYTGMIYKIKSNSDKTRFSTPPDDHI